VNGPTFSRDHWLKAQDAWKDGDFSDEWKPWRHEAAMRGMIYPPDGSKWDTWEDDEPSQRAMLIRAIRETPNLLHKAIAVSRSWFDVIAYINRERDDWRAQVSRQATWDDEHRDEADPREATVALKRIIERIRES
jgi:hypothetical protein